MNISPFFTTPHSSLRPGTLKRTKKLLALLPLIQKAFDTDDNVTYSSLLRKLFKLDPEVCKDFGVAVVLAKEADLTKAYFSFVADGLVARGRWQEGRFFSWIGFCAHSVSSERLCFAFLTRRSFR